MNKEHGVKEMLAGIASDRALQGVSNPNTFTPSRSAEVPSFNRASTYASTYAATVTCARRGYAVHVKPTPALDRAA